MVEVRLRGARKPLYCLDIARSINLVRVQESSCSSRRSAFHHQRRVPAGAGVSPALRVTKDTAAQAVGRHATAPAVELALDHLGALCSTWDLPFEEPVDRLVEPSALLYDHAGLIARSREVAHEVRALLADSPRALARILCVEEQELAFRMGGDPEACTRAWRTCRRTAARSSASVYFTPFR